MQTDPPLIWANVALSVAAVFVLDDTTLPPRDHDLPAERPPVEAPHRMEQQVHASVASDTVVISVLPGDNRPPDL